jgi:hypothetical protein
MTWLILLKWIVSVFLAKDEAASVLLMGHWRYINSPCRTALVSGWAAAEGVSRD